MSRSKLPPITLGDEVYLEARLELSEKLEVGTPISYETPYRLICYRDRFKHRPTASSSPPGTLAMTGGHLHTGAAFLTRHAENGRSFPPRRSCTALCAGLAKQNTKKSTSSRLIEHISGAAKKPPANFSRRPNGTDSIGG
jgi:hypothetical protein